MNNDFFEKEIYLNKNDKCIVKIDNKISDEKVDIIVKEFGRLIKDMKEKQIDISKYQAENFDYIVIMLLIRYCTNLFGNRKFSIQEITATYSDMFQKNLIQQISSVFMEQNLKNQVIKIMIACDMVVQYEQKIGIKLLSPKEEDINMIEKKEIIKSKQPTETKVIFDELLDQYNDMIRLYKLFGDASYKRKATRIFSKMKEHMNDNKQYEVMETKTLSDEDVLKIYSKIEKETSFLDSLLDQYNDYMTLYKIFGDSKYKIQATKIMNKIKKINDTV